MTDYFHDLDVLGKDTILLFPPSFNSSPRDKMVGDHQVVISGGAEEVVEISPDLFWHGEYNKFFTNYEEQHEFMEFVKLKMGRLRTFWFPSFVSDFTLYQDTGGPSGHCIYVVPNNFNWAFDSGRYGLFVQTVNDRHIWEISDYKADPNNPFDLLFTKSQLGKKILRREVLFASIIRFVRFDTDKFTMSMESPAAGDMGYTFLERPNESTFLSTKLIADMSMEGDHESSFSAELMVGADWWDPSSDVNNADGDGRELRTNSFGATLEVETDLGTTSVGVIPSDLPYNRQTVDGRVLENTQPIWGYRSRTVDAVGDFTGPWSEWSYSEVTPHHDYGNGYAVVKDLDPLLRHRIQLILVQADLPPNTGDRFTRFLEPGEASMADPLTAEVWPTEEINTDQFWQIKGFSLNKEGSLRSWSDSRQKLKVLVLGDGDMGGIVLHTPADNFEMPSDPTRDRRGASISWPRLVADAYELTQDVRVSLCNHAHERTGFMDAADKVRSGTTPSGEPPTLHGMADLINKYDLRTNSRNLKTTWVPNIVMFGYTVEDQRVASFVDDLYMDNDSRDAANALWAAIRGSWNCHIMLVPFPRVDTELPDNYVSSQEVLVRAELISSVTVDHAVDSWIESVSIDALGTTNRETTLTAAEHIQIQGIVSTPFDSKSDEILGL